MGSGLWPAPSGRTRQHRHSQDGRPGLPVSYPDLLQSQAMVGLDLAVFEGLLLLVGTSAAWHDSHHDLAPEWPDYLDAFKAELRHPREELGLQFPALSARQKQFALSPGHPEYYRERPDFLQFGLQALDDSSDPRQEAARESEKEALILEKQLEAVLEGLHHGDGVGDTKRAMVGEPRALPYITSGQVDQGDDTIFATVIAATTAGAVFAVLGVGYCYHRASQVSKEGEVDYTVYECPGLASTDEMEVKNPLFNDDPTP